MDGSPGPLIAIGDFVVKTKILESGNFSKESKIFITAKGIAFFHFLLCESMKVRRYDHPMNYTIK